MRDDFNGYGSDDMVAFILGILLLVFLASVTHGR